MRCTRCGSIPLRSTQSTFSGTDAAGWNGKDICWGRNQEARRPARALKGYYQRNGSQSETLSVGFTPLATRGSVSGPTLITARRAVRTVPAKTAPDRMAKLCKDCGCERNVRIAFRKPDFRYSCHTVEDVSSRVGPAQSLWRPAGCNDNVLHDRGWKSPGSAAPI